MPTTLLVAEDEASIRDLLRDFFEGQGYAVVTATDGQEALAAAREAAPDLVLLDVMMPWMDGFEVIRQLRRDGETPVILLTARAGEADKVEGLGLGADDYVTKPFSFHEVAARVEAVLRRARRGADVLRGGDIVLDTGAHRTSARGQAVDLTRAEQTVLRALMEASGRVLSRADLLDVLGLEHGSERTVDSHVRNLRAKVEADPGAPTHVETVFGVGYRFGPPVRS
ncbi:response regulator transcription factor [Rubricoccus marinus]|uniref:DNA-binding response regulator n=1 Tax=Rubricoccus marinus TaxID=716817 RepID=A0A259U0S9_9BACT|nr:response regulator transcription factor [Rubricoccus marinus]OZC03591.1 hypothetical protein BSZ36_11720 [Rubricoccus marinus]